jgi:AraC family transcriptional regulator
LGKIAVDLERALAQRTVRGTAGQLTERPLARGDGWTVEDMVCTSGPGDRPFEEQHSHVAIAVVVAGSFQYRSATGRELMTPGSLLLGNAGQCFECGHEHDTGDRCISFRYTADYFERLAADVGAPRVDRHFRAPRLPPVRELSSLVAQACAGLVGFTDLPWEEVSVQLAVQVIRLAGGLPTGAAAAAPPRAVARVTQTVRAIERQPAARLTLGSMAWEAGLSPYHFLRTFERLTGLTPHQYVRRARLRNAATRLAAEPARVIDVAFDCGFGDVSNFNRAFRAEFGVSPRAYRARSRATAGGRGTARSSVRSSRR